MTIPTRRSLLRGAAASLALPLLPSALPRAARAASSASPKRFLVAVVPNGIFTPGWEPNTLGAGYALTEILTPAAALKSRMTVVSGLQNRAEEAMYAEHTPAMGTILTDTPFEFGIGGNGTPNGISVDQVMADHYGALTPYRSLQFGVENDGAIETPYTWQISWGNGDTPFPPVLEPRDMFNRLFGASSGLSEEEMAAIATMRASILDRVKLRTASLKVGLSAGDLTKLDQYETAVREIELRLDQLDGITCGEPDEPDANPGFAAATTLMYDLMFKAVECDLTRIVSFSQGQTVSDQVYGHLGITSGHHTLSHTGWGGGQAEADYKRINTWQFEMFCGLVQQLADTEDVDGNDMLSNTICLFTTEFSNSGSHLAYGDYSLPMAILGGENLGIVQGEHRRFAGEAHGSLLLTLLHHMGIEQDAFGLYGTKVLSLG